MSCFAYDICHFSLGSYAPLPLAPTSLANTRTRRTHISGALTCGRDAFSARKKTPLGAQEKRPQGQKRPLGQAGQATRRTTAAKTRRQEPAPRKRTRRHRRPDPPRQGEHSAGRTSRAPKNHHRQPQPGGQRQRRPGAGTEAGKTARRPGRGQQPGRAGRRHEPHEARPSPGPGTGAHQGARPSRERTTAGTPRARRHGPHPRPPAGGQADQPISAGSAAHADAAARSQGAADRAADQGQPGDRKRARATEADQRHDTPR
jgi:hypothetical protein